MKLFLGIAFIVFFFWFIFPALLVVALGVGAVILVSSFLAHLGLFPWARNYAAGRGEHTGGYTRRTEEYGGVRVTYISSERNAPRPQDGQDQFEDPPEEIIDLPQTALRPEGQDKN